MSTSTFVKVTKCGSDDLGHHNAIGVGRKWADVHNGNASRGPSVLGFVSFFLGGSMYQQHAKSVSGMDLHRQLYVLPH